MMLRLADLIRASLLVGVAVSAVVGRVEPVLRFLLVLGLTLLARWLRVPRPFGLALTAVLAVEVWGRFGGLYRAWAPFDEVIHLLAMGCLAPLVYLLGARSKLVPPLEALDHTRQRVALPALSGMVGLALGAAWEVYEWLTVTFLGADILTGYDDAILDLVIDCCGAVAGGGLLVVWALRRWPTQSGQTVGRVGRT